MRTRQTFPQRRARLSALAARGCSLQGHGDRLLQCDQQAQPLVAATILENNSGTARQRHASDRGSRIRRAATVIETALVLPVFLSIVVGLMDLAGAVYRHNIVSEGARRGAREAMVHGSQAGPLRTVLGPQTWNGTAADEGEVATTIRSLLAGIEPADVAIRLEWPDGSNTAPNRVRCTVTTQYQGVTFILGGQTLTLQATSTLPIAH